MPVDGTTIAAQTGASGGLWTHTPVDWRGNEGPTAKPGGWPNDAIVAVPPAGTTAGAAAPTVTVSALSASGITTTGATVNYYLSAAATATVQYGVTPAYGQANTPAAGNGSQSKPLTGLTTGTVYYYRVTATPAGGAATTSPGGTFTTL